MGMFKISWLSLYSIDGENVKYFYVLNIKKLASDCHVCLDEHECSLLVNFIQ